MAKSKKRIKAQHAKKLIRRDNKTTMPGLKKLLSGKLLRGREN